MRRSSRHRWSAFLHCMNYLYSPTHNILKKPDHIGIGLTALQLGGSSGIHAPMSWPQSIPPDLRRALEGVLSTRSHGPAEIWGEVRDWLEKHGVEAPERLPEDPPYENAKR